MRHATITRDIHERMFGGGVQPSLINLNFSYASDGPAEQCHTSPKRAERGCATWQIR